MQESRVAAGRRELIADAVICVGLVATVAATFLPWAHSGRATRNAYSAGGLIKRLLGVDGVAALLLDALPFLALACGAVVALIVLGHGAGVRPATVAGRVGAAVVALAVIGAAVAAFTSGQHFGVTPAGAGPGVALAGAVAVLIGCAGAVLYRPVR